MIEYSILTTSRELEIWRKNQKSKICLVPTMGGLHEGHAELIRQAKNSSAKVVVSVFVNPLQFSAEEDFEKYPRMLEKDAELAFLNGADIIWAPSVKEIFPNGLKDHFQVKVPEFLKSNLCGSRRKGHFDGVATIILHILQFVRPEVLILGEKDWQQFIIIRHLIKDFNLSIELQGVATIRDKTGLALSSRNRYLNNNEKKICRALPNSLKKALEDHKNGEEIHLKEIYSDLNQKCLSVEYLEVVDPYTMQHVEIGENLCLLAAAVRCGDTRLIDHVFLMKRAPIVAIDGPAGAGKSTVTKAFAKRLGLTYLDTGAMYRAITLVLQEQNIDPKNHTKVKKMLSNINLKLEQTSTGDQKVIINGNEVSKEIRSPKVTSFVSVVSAELPIREFLTSQQKKMGEFGGLVAEGRDIGSTVFPDAELKIFLTASVTERAKRRASDMKLRGYDIPNFENLEREIIKRDQMDSNREISPLIQAEDAIELITDSMNIEEVVKKMIELFRLKIPHEVWPSKF